MEYTNTQTDTLQAILNDALRYCCPQIAQDASIQQALQDTSIVTQDELGHVMLTVSGIEFCAVTILHYPNGEHAKQAYFKLRAEESTSSATPNWEPFYTEMGNHLCGRIKNYFHQQYEHLGMSTPWLLSATTDLVELNNPHLQASGHVLYTCNNLPILGASLYVFSAAPMQLHKPKLDSSEPTSTGELEFF